MVLSGREKYCNNFLICLLFRGRHSHGQLLLPDRSSIHLKVDFLLPSLPILEFVHLVDKGGASMQLRWPFVFIVLNVESHTNNNSWKLIDRINSEWSMYAKTIFVLYLVLFWPRQLSYSYLRAYVKMDRSNFSRKNAALKDDENKSRLAISETIGAKMDRKNCKRSWK